MTEDRPREEPRIGAALLASLALHLAAFCAVALARGPGGDTLGWDTLSVQLVPAGVPGGTGSAASGPAVVPEEPASAGDAEEPAADEETAPVPDDKEGEEAPAEQPEPEPEPEEDAGEPPPDEESEAVTAAPEPEESTTEKPQERPEEPKPQPPAKPKRSTPQPGAEAKGRSGASSGEGTAERGSGPAARAGAPGGTGFRLDSAFPYPWYLELVQRRLSEGWLKPAGARPSRPAVIYFRILPEGRLGLVEVESSSGMPLFDRSALRAVKTLDRLPPLPRGFREAYLGVHCEFLP